MSKPAIVQKSLGVDAPFDIVNTFIVIDQHPENCIPMNVWASLFMVNGIPGLVSGVTGQCTMSRNGHIVL